MNDQYKPHSDTEEEHFRKKLGKWSKIGVPHKGWMCEDVEDLGEPSDICEMCEFQIIRYVHVMSHSKYSTTLRVGRICAGHMEGDICAAKSRESKIKNESARRANWLKLKGWKTSKRGNPYINKDGFNVVVYRMNARFWRGNVKLRDTEETRKTRPCKTEEQAKLDAFEIKRLWELEIENNPFVI